MDSSVSFGCTAHVDPMKGIASVLTKPKPYISRASHSLRGLVLQVSVRPWRALPVLMVLLLLHGLSSVLPCPAHEAKSPDI